MWRCRGTVTGCSSITAGTTSPTIAGLSARWGASGRRIWRGLSDVSGPGRRGTVVRRSAGIVGRDPRCGCARAEGRGHPRAPRGNLTPDGRGFAPACNWRRPRRWRGEGRGRSTTPAGGVGWVEREGGGGGTGGGGREEV